MANGIGRFNLLDAITNVGFGREKSFNKFLKGQSKRITDTVAAKADELKAESEKKPKGIGGKDLPWLKTALSFLGPWGKVANVAISLADTIKKNKDYRKSIKSVGKDIKVPDWAKGTFMEDYFTSNVDYLQDIAVQKLKGTRDAELALGVGGTLLDMFSAGKGFKKAGVDKATQALKEFSKGNIDTSLAKDKFETALFEGWNMPAKAGPSFALGGLKDFVEPMRSLSSLKGPSLISQLGKLGQGVGQGVGKGFQQLPNIISSDSPWGKTRFGTGMNLATSPIFKGSNMLESLTTPSTYSSFLQKPLLDYATGRGRGQEPTIQSMLAPTYRRRR